MAQPSRISKEVLDVVRGIRWGGVSDEEERNITDSLLQAMEKQCIFSMEDVQNLQDADIKQELGLEAVGRRRRFMKAFAFDSIPVFSCLLSKLFLFLFSSVARASLPCPCLEGE